MILLLAEATNFKSGIDVARSPTLHSMRAGPSTMTWDPTPLRAQDRGFGGFPGPLDVAGRAIRRIIPNIEQKITMPRTETLISQMHSTGGQGGGQARTVPYLRFDTVVGRNSVFHDLTQEKLEELGGVEYRALTALLWLVGCVSYLLFLHARLRTDAVMCCSGKSALS